MVGGPLHPEETVAALVLRDLPGVGPVHYRRLVDRFGGAVGALRASEHAFRSMVGAAACQARRERRRRERATELLTRCRRAAIYVVTLGQDRYPDALLDLSDPPPVLFAKGRLDLLQGSGAAVVGSRRATVYGRRTAYRIGRFLADQGRPVISGMALGVDAEAHRGALPGPTVAVLGSGVDVPTPTRNAPLYRDIVESGIVLSSFDPGTPAQAHHFPARNRLIAALAKDIIVVEATDRSGALITAGVGLDLGREVHAVPGPIDRPTSRGTNRLISEGASPVLEIGPVEGWSSEPRPQPRDADLRMFLVHVPERPATIDEVAARAAVTVAQASVLITRLQLQGFVSAAADGMILRTPGGSGGRS